MVVSEFQTWLSKIFLRTNEMLELIHQTFRFYSGHPNSKEEGKVFSLDRTDLEQFKKTF